MRKLMFSLAAATALVAGATLVGPASAAPSNGLGSISSGRGNAGRCRTGRNRLRPVALLAHLGLPPIWFLPSVAPPLLVVSLRSGSIASFQ